LQYFNNIMRNFLKESIIRALYSSQYNKNNKHLKYIILINRNYLSIYIFQLINQNVYKYQYEFFCRFLL